MLLANADEPESLLKATGKVTSGLGDAVGPGHPEEAYGQIAEAGHDLGAIPLAHLAAVFVEGDVPNIMDFVFDGPVPADVLEEDGRAVELRREAADSIRDFPFGMVAVEVGGVALNAKGRLSMRHVQLAGELIGRRKRSGLNPTVGFVDGRLGLLRGKKRPRGWFRSLFEGSAGCLWR